MDVQVYCARPFVSFGLLMSDTVTIAHSATYTFGSLPSDHYFRSVCLFVCAEFFSAVFDPIWIKLGHMLHVRV